MADVGGISMKQPDREGTKLSPKDRKREQKLIWKDEKLKRKMARKEEKRARKQDRLEQQAIVGYRASMEVPRVTQLLE